MNIVSGDSTLFCGGPINSLAWMPTPQMGNHDQILAVSAALDPDKMPMLGQVHSEPGLIQFWNCGSLRLVGKSESAPKLEFCLLHDYGTIWHMEWCPSGCYTKSDVDKPRRYGVLAVGCSDSFIYIYSVCNPDKLR